MSGERFSDALDAQVDIARYYRSDDALEYIRWAGTKLSKADSVAPMFGLDRPVAFTRMVTAVCEDSDPHYVESGVCQLLMETAHLLPEDAVLNDQLFPHEGAFVYFATPMKLPAVTMVLRCAVVQKVTPELYKENVRSGLLLLMFSTLAENRWAMPELHGVSFWYYGSPWTLEPELHVGESHTLSNDEMRAVYVQLKQYLMALFAFEKQKLTVAAHERGDRASRKRAESVKHPTDMVRVVKLRKVEYVAREQADDGGPVRHVGVRYYVEPFWRNQFYPSENAHHPKLVVAHWRGSGPTQITRKVYDVIR